MGSKSSKKRNEKQGKGADSALPQASTICIIVLLLIAIALAVFVALNKVEIADLKKKTETGTVVGVNQAYKDRLKAEMLQEIAEAERLQEELTRSNASEKLVESKMLGQLEITDITLNTLDNSTTMNANVVNRGDVADGDFTIIFKFVSEDGVNIMETEAYISRIEPGASTPLSVTVSDLRNVYDFEIIRHD